MINLHLNIIMFWFQVWQKLTALKYKQNSKVNFHHKMVGCYFQDRLNFLKQPPSICEEGERQRVC